MATEEPQYVIVMDPDKSLRPKPINNVYQVFIDFLRFT